MGPPSGSRALASPKSRTLTFPSGVTLTLAGFRSRVNDALGVGRLERLRDLPGQGERLLDRQGSSGQPVVESLTRDQLEDQEARAAGILEPVQRRDRRVAERGEEARLAVEPRLALGFAGERVRKDLERDLPPKPAVAGAPNRLNGRSCGGGAPRRSSETQHTGPAVRQPGIAGRRHRDNASRT